MVTLALIVIAIVFVVLVKRGKTKPPHEVIPSLQDKGVKMIYNSEYDDRTYKCYKHRIKARPDFIYEHPEKSLTIVEYKSRKNGIMPSDINQLVATGIAVKSECSDKSVTKGYVMTAGHSYQSFDLSKNIDELASFIDRPTRAIRNIFKDIEPKPQASVKKCGGCGYRDKCNHAYKS